MIAPKGASMKKHGPYTFKSPQETTGENPVGEKFFFEFFKKGDLGIGVLGEDFVSEVCIEIFQRYLIFLTHSQVLLLQKAW